MSIKKPNLKTLSKLNYFEIIKFHSTITDYFREQIANQIFKKYQGINDKRYLSHLKEKWYADTTFPVFLYVNFTDYLSKSPLVSNYSKLKELKYLARILELLSFVILDPPTSLSFSINFPNQKEMTILNNPIITQWNISEVEIQINSTARLIYHPKWFASVRPYITDNFLKNTFEEWITGQETSLPYHQIRKLKELFKRNGNLIHPETKHIILYGKIHLVLGNIIAIGKFQNLSIEHFSDSPYKINFNFTFLAEKIIFLYTSSNFFIFFFSYISPLISKQEEPINLIKKSIDFIKKSITSFKKIF